MRHIDGVGYVDFHNANEEYEKMIPMSVIEDIKADIDKEYKWLMATKHTLYDIDIAFDSIKKAIDRHISGKENQ